MESSARAAFEAQLLKHPEAWALAAWRLEPGAPRQLHRPGAWMPMGSVMKLGVLWALGEALAQGRLDPEAWHPQAEVEAFWWPASDGGSHQAALASLQARAGAQAVARWGWAELAWAMVAHSDNAATDFLIWRLGQGAMEAFPAAVGLAGRIEPPVSTLGAFLTWLGPQVGHRPYGWNRRVLGMDRGLFRHEAARRAAQLLERPEALAWLRAHGIHQLPERRVQRLATTLPMGQAEAIAELMARFLVGDWPWPKAWAGWCRQALDWPLQAAPHLQAQHRHLLYKPGSLEGVWAGAWAQAPASGAPGGASVLVLLMHPMPLPFWRACLRSGSPQAWERAHLVAPEALRPWLARLQQAPPGA